MQIKLLRFFFLLASRLMPSAAARIGLAFFYAPRRFPAPKWEGELLAVGRPARFRFDGEILDATVWEQAGPTALLVHGWEGRRGQMAKIAVSLFKAGFRVVAVDGPAHGSSSKKRTTLVEFADAVDAAAREFGPLHSIVGHSFGSAAAAIAVRKGLAVERLVLISCPYSLRNVVSGFARMVRIGHRAHEMMYPLMGRLHGCEEADLSFEAIGPDLRVDCLLVHDLNDKYIPSEDGDRVQLLITDSRIVKTKGLGHTRILQDAGVVTRVTSFISGVA